MREAVLALFVRSMALTVRVQVPPQKFQLEAANQITAPVCELVVLAGLPKKLDQCARCNTCSKAPDGCKLHHSRGPLPKLLNHPLCSPQFAYQRSCTACAAANTDCCIVLYAHFFWDECFYVQLAYYLGCLLSHPAVGEVPSINGNKSVPCLPADCQCEP